MLLWLFFFELIADYFKSTFKPVGFGHVFLYASIFPCGMWYCHYMDRTI